MASRGLNKVTLIGNVGQDPEIRHTQDNVMMANLSLATTSVWNDRQTNERKERTEWHRVVLFRGLAEIADKWVRKGSSLYIEGRLQTRKWQDQQGNDRYTTEVVANELIMLGRGGSDTSGSQSSYGGGSSDRSSARSESSGETRTIDDDFDDVPW